MIRFVDRAVSAVVASVACVLLVTACTAPTATETSPTPGEAVADLPISGTPPTGILPGYRVDIDEISPLLITSLAPDPVPFTGTDGNVHLAYELQIINASPRAATMTSLEMIADGPDGAVIATLAPEQIAERTLIVGDATMTLGNEIPGGRVALVLLDTQFDSDGDVPAAFIHRVSATFASSADDDRVTKLYPTEAVQFGGAVTTSTAAPVTIGPPLTGDGWVTIGSCCTLAGHRAFMLPLGGRMNATERFALEYIKIDVDASPLIDEQTGEFASFRGDPTLPESYFAFGQDVLAVADGTVTAVVSDFEDRAVGSFEEGLSIEDLTGNYVVIDLGDGVSAMANHLKQGSPTVAVGDRVTKGQVIGQLGNSGNSAQPHLHFQLYRGIAPLAGDNVAFEIDSFVFDGTITVERLDPTDAGPRTDQYPLNESVTSYPSP